MNQRTDLAAGPINASDRIVIELIVPPDTPPVVAITWPAKPTVCTPGNYAEVAAAARRLLAAPPQHWPGSKHTADERDRILNALDIDVAYHVINSSPITRRGRAEIWFRPPSPLADQFPPSAILRPRSPLGSTPVATETSGLARCVTSRSGGPEAGRRQ
jgi:hypothetical protein